MSRATKTKQLIKPIAKNNLKSISIIILNFLDKGTAPKIK